MERRSVPSPPSEIGIGNTTAASALTAALLALPPGAVVGPGPGPRGARSRLQARRQAVEAALVRLRGDEGPFELLAELGGFENAGLVGVMEVGARARRAVVVDGFITGAAALVVARLSPPARDYMVAGHLSVEPGHRLQVEALSLEPLLDLGLRPGEGTGALLALPPAGVRGGAVEGDGDVRVGGGLRTAGARAADRGGRGAVRIVLFTGGLEGPTA